MLILVSLFCGLAFAAGADYAPTSLKSAFEIQQQGNGSMEIDFRLPQYRIVAKESNGQTFHRIELPGAGTLMKSGLPELPVITTTIAIPHQGGVNVEVINSQQSIITQYNAYPLQQGAELESPKAFVQNADYYGSGGAYPAAAIEYSDPQILRDFRIITVQVNPFSYNPTTNELTVHTDIRMRLNYTNEVGINEMPTPVQYVSPAFDKIYSSLIQNYDDYRSLLIANTPPRYLIIHGTTTDAAFLASLNLYATWKRQKGADVDIATTAANSAGSSTSSIQTFIRNRYNNPATRPDFVILIGDTVGSYAIPSFINNSGGTDYPYTHMNTGDLLGDLFIGRISVENLNQFLVVLEKIYLYERDINLETADWLNHMLLVGDNQPSGISTMYISKYIKEMAIEVNPENTFTEMYGPDFSSFVSGINTAFNQGISFYSFRGYIDFSPPAEGSLFNGFKLPHAVIITCATGNYWNGLGETEQLLRYGTTAAPKGSVTAVGMSTASTHTTFNNVLHGGIFEGIYARGMRTMGEAVLHGQLYMNEMFGVSSPANAEKFAHWCNLMGDPTMEVFVGIPDSFQITTDDVIPLGLRLLDVAVRNQDNMPVEGASVVLSLGTTILSRGYTDLEGNVILILPETMSPGLAEITIHKHNFKPLQSLISIESLATLVPGDIVIDDDNSGASMGNNNGLASAGESLEIYFGLHNTGTTALENVSGTVVSDSPWINIVSNSISYPTIPANGNANNLGPLVVEIDPATPHQTMLRLHLLLSDGSGNSYDVSEFIPVESPVVEFVSLSIPGSGILNPDDTSNITVSIKNIGPVPVSDVYARLYTHNDLLSVVNNTSYIGDLSSADVVLSGTFQVWQRPQTLPGMQMPLYLRLYNEAGFEQIVDFNLNVGSVGTDTPLGPDSYGYVIYDWTDPYYQDMTAYNWVSIAPSAGGLGTALPISDIYNASNEGDQVGAQSLAVVNLPFPFQFYGRLYEQITVCSNGFIAMGVTENAEFRNFRLPGAMGPSPMIAPFWDDLATHSGSGIYYMFDRTNHAFIVEWNNLLNGKNGTSPETFQVILYDQATYNTSLGDGPIKFQYHTFNNVDSQSANRHGNYATIGIEDHTGTRGLEYTFNNVYAPAAAPLSHGKALFITNVPTYYEAANLLIANTYLGDANNVVEPGETVSLGVLLENTGNLTAQDITAELSTADPYITMITPTSEYFPLGAGESGVNRSPFKFSVAEDCPAGRVISFQLHVTSGDASWDRAFSIQVNSAKLQYHSFMINDYDANFNGIIDPEEEVQIVVNLRNASDVDARNVVASLSSEVPNLTIYNPVISEINIGANQIMQIAFNVNFAGTSIPQDYVTFDLSATPESGEGLNVVLHIPYNLPNVVHRFDINNGGFISETGWTWGVPQNVNAFSGDKVWATNLSGEYPINIQYHLYTPRYTLQEGSMLSFMHYYGTEANYDGVNVAISTNAGNSWTIITPQGGYNGSGIAGLNMENGWTGNSNAWIPANFDLAAYANQEVMFRFRLGSNGVTNGMGWFIDDFQLSNVNLKTGFLHGMVYPSSGISPELASVMSSTRYTTRPKADGYFRLFLPNGNHSVTSGMPYHQSSSLNNFQISIQSPVVQTEFTLIDLPGVSTLNYNLSNDSVQLTLSWDEPSDPVLPVTGYKVYKRFNAGPFQVVQTSAQTAYSEERHLEGSYYYYITTLYGEFEGSPSEVLMLGNPFVNNLDDVVPGLKTALDMNYPNPFNPTTTISFSLAEATRASLKIYNTKGQLVRQLLNSDLAAGKHHLVWDGRDSNGRPVSSGVYLYRLSSKNFSQTRKMMLMK